MNSLEPCLRTERCSSTSQMFHLTVHTPLQLLPNWHHGGLAFSKSQNCFLINSTLSQKCLLLLLTQVSTPQEQLIQRPHKNLGRLVNQDQGEFCSKRAANLLLFHNLIHWLLSVHYLLKNEPPALNQQHTWTHSPPKLFVNQSLCQSLDNFSSSTEGTWVLIFSRAVQDTPECPSTTLTPVKYPHVWVCFLFSLWFCFNGFHLAAVADTEIWF